jgi:hypothetical protein
MDNPSKFELQPLANRNGHSAFAANIARRGDENTQRQHERLFDTPEARRALICGWDQFAL